MNRLVNYIIEDIRNHTENTDFSDTIGIEDSEFLRFINDAQYRIHGLITQQHPQVFLEEKEVNIVKDQENYNLPFNVFLANKVSSIEYSPTALSKDYYDLKRGTLRQRYAGAEGDPYWYIRKSAKLLLNPIPNSSTGKLRYTYVKAIPRLAKRRASVSAVTLDNSTNTITSLSLNVSTDTIDSDVLDKFTRICVVDAEGEQQMKNIRFDSIDSTTGVVTINSAFTFEEGETISVGDYIVEGRNSTTHSILEDSIERYLIAYCSMKIFHRDSSTDIEAQAQILRDMENEIVASYADISDDIDEIPIIISEDDSWEMF